MLEARRPRVGSAIIIVGVAALALFRPTIAEDGPKGRIAPGPVVVRLKDPAGKPVAGVYVRLGGRYAATDAAGTATLDGVPRGNVTLVVAQSGFERIERPVELAPGERAPIELALAPVVPVSFSAFACIEDGRPLPGAHVSFVPVDVHAAVQGRIEATAGWDGKLAIREVPPGAYRAAVSAAGCAARSFDVTVKTGMAELRFELTREWRPADLAVTVRDAATGKAVSGAQVVLAEAWPKGLVGETKTDEKGEAAFRDLKVGRLNWADDKGHVGVSRAAVTVRAEASGYSPSLAPLTLRPGARVTLELSPTAKIVEKKPNDTQDKAQPIQLGAPVELKIEKAGQRSFFQFRLKEPAQLKITLNKCPIETYVALLGANGKVAENGVYANNENVVNAGVRAGQYYLQVENWGSTHTTDAPLTLVVAGTTAPDALEPNDTPASARVIESGEEVRATIFPNGDVDCFRFDMKRPGTVRFTMPKHSIEQKLTLRDAGGRELGTAGVYAGNVLQLVVPVRAGAHVLEVHNWGETRSSTDPYTVRFDAIESDGTADPPELKGRPSAVRSIATNGLAGSTINPLRTVHRYAVSLPSAGILRTHASAPIDIIVRIRGSDGRVVAEQGAYALNPCDTAWSAPGPTTCYVEVSSWSGTTWSASPYTLATAWEPCDELEAMGRNDTKENPTPFEAGTVLRGSICPVGDVDWYRVEVDHPGYLALEGMAPCPLLVRIHDASGTKTLAEIGAYAGNPIKLGAEVFPGACYVEVQGWGGGVFHPGCYELRTTLHRAEFMETIPLADDPIRTLHLGEAQPFVIDHVKDRDRFLVTVAEAATYVLRVRPGDIAVMTRVFDDRTNEKVFEDGVYAGNELKRDLVAKGAVRWRIEVTHWGESQRTIEPGYVFVDREGRDLVAEKIEATTDPCDPTAVTFTRRPLAGVAAGARIAVSATGSGRADFELEAGRPHVYRYAAEGLYRATALVEGPKGQKTIERLWVEAQGPHERRGVRLMVDDPREGEVVEKDEPCRARAVSYTGARIARVALEVDGRPAGARFSAPFELEVPWSTLGPGKHVLTVTASDARGEHATVSRTAELSPYFDLSPPDGAILTGNAVRVTWTGAAISPSSVRYRVRGETAWKEAKGERGRAHVVLLEDVEPNKLYEMQPLGGAEPGPLRAFTRAKGLAFGRARYAATIARDYDQRVGVSVRNDSDKPRVLRLECGKPESDLLVGFVGEGSEGAPISLAPGEERELLLGLSAQDAVHPTFTFPIRITGETGPADEAEVVVQVKLPRVDLAWVPVGASGTLGQRYRLENHGDTITDLAIGAAGDGVHVSPSPTHGLLAAGASLDVTVTPRLSDGFSSVAAVVSAGAIGTSKTLDFKCGLSAGQKVFDVPLAAGEGAGSDEAVLLHARQVAGAFLDPSNVDWKKGTPESTHQDGRIDRWTVDDPVEGIRWVGEDTQGTGEVDFVTGDVGSDGQIDYAAVKTNDGWQRTNVVEGWLEVKFALPWARNLYEKHDLDVVLNGHVVGHLKDVVPEGNYTFRVAPTLIKFGSDGTPEGDEVEIHSTHLRGGHYVVSSDFRFSLRTTGGRTWTVAESADQAKKLAQSAEGVSLSAPDYSVSSSEVEVAGDMKPGSPVTVSVPVRNVGATRSRRVAVALVAAKPGEAGAEVARRVIEEPPLTGATRVELPWTAAPGTHTLRVVVDPDSATGDANRTNNEASTTVTVPGAEGKKPTVELQGLADGATVKDTVLPLAALAKAENGVASVEAQVDGGLFSPLEAGEKGLRTGKALVQPGAHVVNVRATDAAGNRVEKAIHVNVDAPLPEAELLEPKNGASIGARSTPLKLKVGPDTQLAAYRVNGGPWRRANVSNGVATATAPLPAGKANIEAMTANSRGAMKIIPCRVDSLTDVGGTDAVAPLVSERPDDGIVEIRDMGPVDLFQAPSRVVPPKSSVVAPPVGPRGDAAGATSPTVPDFAPPGALVSVQRKAADWYCTNRPNIKVGFKLPDWLKNKDLPLPGTKEFDETVKQLLDQLRKKGIDTKPFEDFQKKLLQRVRNMKDTEGIPTFLESLGFPHKPKPGEKWIEEGRRLDMENAANAWWIKLLASGDPELIRQGLLARGSALKNFDEGLQLDADAAITAIKANQKLVDEALNAIPLVGDANMILGIIRGESLDGEHLSALERVFNSALIVGGHFLSKALEAPGGEDALSSILEKTKPMSEASKEALAKSLGMDVKQLESSLASIEETLVKKRAAAESALRSDAEAAGRAFASDAAGAADKALMEADRAAAQKTVDRVIAAQAKGDAQELEAAVLELQRDKTAQALINNKSVVADEVRSQAKATIEKIYEGVDTEVKAALRDKGVLEDAAKKLGVKADELEVGVMKITNERPGSVSTSFGRDRDVTYVINKLTKDPVTGAVTREVVQDVDHAVSKAVYEEALWLKTKGPNLPKGEGGAIDRALLSKNASELDQTVTSKWHPEAYNVGEVKLADFLDKSKKPTLTRIEDVRDTVTHKSEEWFAKAADAAKAGDAVMEAKNAGEGMRQAVKQWNDLVLSRVEQYGQVAQVAVPPRLQVGMEIFDRVNKGFMGAEGGITVKQAESMLSSLGKEGVPVTMDSVVKDMGTYLEAVEKGPGETFRALKTAELTNELKALPGEGTAAWRDATITKINDALANGKVSADTFNSMRSDFFSGVEKAAANPQQRTEVKAWLKSAQDRRLINGAERGSLEARLGPG